jgi:hypothetical protein
VIMLTSTMAETSQHKGIREEHLQKMRDGKPDEVFFAPPHHLWSYGAHGNVQVPLKCQATQHGLKLRENIKEELSLPFDSIIQHRGLRQARVEMHVVAGLWETTELGNLPRFDGINNQCAKGAVAYDNDGKLIGKAQKKTRICTTKQALAEGVSCLCTCRKGYKHAFVAKTPSGCRTTHARFVFTLPSTWSWTSLRRTTLWRTPMRRGMKS